MTAVRQSEVDRGLEAIRARLGVGAEEPNGNGFGPGAPDPVLDQAPTAGDLPLAEVLEADPGNLPSEPATPGASQQPVATSHEDADTAPRIRVETLRELRDRPAEKLPTVGGRRLPRKEIFSIAARGGLGKTTFTRGALVHAAAGRPYCGLDFAEPVRSVYFSGEGCGPLWLEATLRAVEHFGIEEDALERIAVVEGGGPSGLRLNRSDDLDRIRHILDDLKAANDLDLVAFDPFQRFAPGDENSSKDMGAAVDALLEVSREFDVASFVPHHASQAGRGLDAFRGHTTFEGAIATGLVLTAPEPGQRMLEAPKVRYARTAADTRTIWLDFDQEAGIYTERAALGAKTKTGQLLDLLEDGLAHKANDLAIDLGISRSTIRNWIDPAVKSGAVVAEKGPKGLLMVRRREAAESLLETA